MKDMFKFVKDVNSRCTWNAGNIKLYLPDGRNSKNFTDSFYSDGMVWNSIPPDEKLFHLHDLNVKSCYVKWFVYEQ